MAFTDAIAELHELQEEEEDEEFDELHDEDELPGSLPFASSPSWVPLPLLLAPPLPS